MNLYKTTFSKPAIIALLSLISFGQSFAQSNGNFETISCTPTGAGHIWNGFYNNCVPGWKVSHGEPHLIQSYSKIAYLSSVDGIFTNVTLKEGHVYTLRMETLLTTAYEGGIVPEPKPVNIFVIATNNLVNANGVKPSPSEFEVISKFTQSNKNLTEVFSNYNFIPKRNYSNLWIFWEYVNDGVRHAVEIDNVSLTANCPNRQTLYLQDATLSTANTWDGVIIKAGTSVNTNLTQGPAIINATADINFKADQYVDLEYGFDAFAQSTAKFSVDINSQNPCLISGNRVSTSVQHPYGHDREAGLDMFPNPSKGELTFVFSNPVVNGEINIFDILGNHVYHHTLEGTRLNLNLPNLQTGIYTVKAVADGKTFYRKLIIEN